MREVSSSVGQRPWFQWSVMNCFFLSSNSGSVWNHDVWGLHFFSVKYKPIAHVKQYCFVLAQHSCFSCSEHYITCNLFLILRINKSMKKMSLLLQNEILMCESLLDTLINTCFSQHCFVGETGSFFPWYRINKILIFLYYEWHIKSLFKHYRV